MTKKLMELHLLWSGKNPEADLKKVKSKFIKLKLEQNRTKVGGPEDKWTRMTGGWSQEVCERRESGLTGKPPKVQKPVVLSWTRALTSEIYGLAERTRLSWY